MTFFSEGKYTQIASSAVAFWQQRGRSGSLKPHMVRAINEANSNLTPEQFREAMSKLGKMLGSRKKERKAGTSKRINRSRRSQEIPARRKSNEELIDGAYQHEPQKFDVGKFLQECYRMHEERDPGCHDRIHQPKLKPQLEFRF